MSIKKRICNWKAIGVASHGDPALAGLFRGATEAVKVMPESIKRWYEAEEIAIAETYMNERAECEYKCHEALAALNRDLLKKLDKPDPK